MKKNNNFILNMLQYPSSMKNSIFIGEFPDFTKIDVNYNINYEVDKITSASSIRKSRRLE